MSDKTNNKNYGKKLNTIQMIALVILSVLLFSVVSVLLCYFIFGDDFKKMAENSATYSENAQISATDGIVSYAKDEDGNYLTDENGKYIQLTASDVAGKISSISRYLTDDEESTKEEKLEYLLNAELVTKFPYIEDLGEDKVNGVVKFYRYRSEDEAKDTNQDKYLIKFIDEETFEAKLKAGDSDIFSYFTINEDQQLVIACESTTQKTITTDDPFITVSDINEEASDEYQQNEDGSFSTGKSTISKQTKDYQSIIENYTMPFNLLAAFLTQTGSYSFTRDIASLAYESEINIGIYENETISERWEEYTYQKCIEYSASTELDFSEVNTSNPVMTVDTLKNLQPNPIQSCIEQLTENQETKGLTVEHRLKNLNGTPGGKPGNDEHMKVQTTYVNDFSGGKITSLGDEAKEFETKYYTKTISRTSVTLGTILAETWIAKWESSYSKTIPEGSGEPQPSSTNIGNSSRRFSSNNDLFSDNAKAEIDENLKEHTDELIQSAINTIMDAAEGKYSVSTREITGADVRKHAINCNSCGAYLNKIWQNYWRNINNVSDETLLKRVQTDQNLVEVKRHVKEEFESNIKAETEEALDNARNNLKIQLEDQIGYIQYPTVALSNVNIKVSTTTIRNTTTYKKDETTSRTNEGEELKKIFDNTKHHESRKAILQDRPAWFWKCIRKTDNTAKLEDVLRYLFNYITGTKDFGDYDNLDSLFRAFEPQELKFNGTIGAVSPFGTNIEREEFIAKAQAYMQSNEEYQRNLASIAGDFYDICETYNVNPGLAFVWACVETGYGDDDSIPYNNLFGMGIDNGENEGIRYASRADSIRGFCQWVVDHVESGSTLQRAQEFATVNSKFKGTAENNIYVLFCQYFYLGKQHYVDEPDFNNPAGTDYYLQVQPNSSGLGGRYYIYEMYEARWFVYRGVCGKMWT